MPNALDRILKSVGLQRSFNPFTPAEWSYLASLGGGYYPQFTQSNKQEPIGQGFYSLVVQAYASNPVVFAAENARVQLFSEARFQYQKLREGRPGELFSTPQLAILEQPWIGGTTSDLLETALLYADFGGNGIIARRNGTLQPLRPDWVTLIAGSPRADANAWDLDVQLLGIGYQPGGPTANAKVEYLQRSEFAHFITTKDPLRRFSGMPWLLSITRDLSSDQAATAHKLMYFENAATPNLAVKFAPTMNLAQAKDWIDLFKKDHEGTSNAFKTLFLGGGSDLVPVGASLRQADFIQVQNGGELRIASAAGVPPIIIGLRGGLDAATYSNYGQARRAFADLTMRPLWRDIAGALQTVIPTPSDARLWYDDRDISFLQEDVKDAAEIQQTQSAAIRQLIDAGFEPETVVDSITANDFSRLKHTGFPSVQLQPSTQTPPAEIPATVDNQPPALQKPTRALIEAAQQELVRSGVKRPTQAQIAEQIGISDRTLRRWGAVSEPVL